MVGLRDVLVVAPTAYHHHDPLLSSADHPIVSGLFNVDDDPRAKRAATGIQFWQQPQPQPIPLPPSASNPNPNSSLLYLTKPAPTLDPLAAAAGGSCACQDCGNQAKKDCSHRRCRTCCKNRGFDCPTHVRSTWVPAARRRERHQSTATATAGSKKARLVSSDATTSHTSTSKSNNTPPRSFDTGSSRQDASCRETLPGHVRAPAVFKCVRVTSIDDGDDEYAYQAAVRIGGHVFKGFLYDHGVGDGRAEDQPCDTNNSHAVPNISVLNLGGGRGGSGSGAPDLYGGAAGGDGLFGGLTAFGNPIN